MVCLVSLFVNDKIDTGGSVQRREIIRNVAFLQLFNRRPLTNGAQLKQERELNKNSLTPRNLPETALLQNKNKMASSNLATLWASFQMENIYPRKCGCLFYNQLHYKIISLCQFTTDLNIEGLHTSFSGIKQSFPKIFLVFLKFSLLI